MRRRLPFLVAAAVAAAAWFVRPLAPAPAANRVTFASWNMEWFPSGWPEPRPEADEAERIREAAAGLRREGVPDVLLVQEVRDAATCSNFLSALGDPGLSLAVCSDFWFSPTNRGLQQLAVFSRYPVLAAGWEPWRVSDFVWPPRGFAWAVLDVRGERVAVFDVHLKSNYVPEGGDEERQGVLNRLKREFAARQLLWRVEDVARTNGLAAKALIVAGDFNTAAEDPRFAKEKTLSLFLRAGWRDGFEGIPESERPTLPEDERYPPATFDHLFWKGLRKPLDRRVGRFLPRVSDHAPIFVTFPVGG